MMQRPVRSVVVTTSILTLCVLGCASKSSDATDPDNADSNESNASEAQASRIDHVLYGSVGSQEPATAAGSVATAQWWPAGCATRTRDATDPRTVHVHLDNCTGPFGLVHHTGDITVTFSKNAQGSLHASATSQNMTVNGHAVSYHSEAEITVDATDKKITIDFHGEWQRQNAKGEPVTHQRQGTTVVDVAAKCRDTNGTATTHAGNREIDSTIKDYKICRKADGSDGCPTGEVDHLRKRTNKTVTITFDGSADAKVTGPNGNTTEEPLVCTP